MKLIIYSIVFVFCFTTLTSNSDKNFKNCPSCSDKNIVEHDKSFFCEDMLFNESQNDDEIRIKQTLLKYIEGTSLGQPEKLRDAFHEDLNLYSVNTDGTLKTWKGTDYINIFKEGKKFNRKGEILSIDFENNAAIAKVKITTASKTFIDYFMLLKINETWKIIHKSYTVKVD